MKHAMLHVVSSTMWSRHWDTHPSSPLKMTGEKKTKKERFGWRSSFNAFSMTISKDLSLNRGIRRRSAWTHFRSGKRWRWSLMTFLGCMWVGHLEAIMDEWTCENLQKNMVSYHWKWGIPVYPSFKSGNSGSKSNLRLTCVTLSWLSVVLGFLGSVSYLSKTNSLTLCQSNMARKAQPFFSGEMLGFHGKSSASGGVSGGCSDVPSFHHFSPRHLL